MTISEKDKSMKFGKTGDFDLTKIRKHSKDHHTHLDHTCKIPEQDGEKPMFLTD